MVAANHSLAPAMKSHRSSATRRQSHPELLPPDLTAAEERVLPYLCAGWNDREIGIELNLPDATVRRHIDSCLRKFGLTGRAQIAARLLQGGGGL